MHNKFGRCCNLNWSYEIVCKILENLFNLLKFSTHIYCPKVHWDIMNVITLLGLVMYIPSHSNFGNPHQLQSRSWQHQTTYVLSQWTPFNWLDMHHISEPITPYFCMVLVTVHSIGSHAGHVSVSLWVAVHVSPLIVSQDVTEDDHTGGQEDNACQPYSKEGVVVLELKEVGSSKPKALHMEKMHISQDNWDDSG